MPHRSLSVSPMGQTLRRFSGLRFATSLCFKVFVGSTMPAGDFKAAAPAYHSSSMAGAASGSTPNQGPRIFPWQAREVLHDGGSPNNSPSSVTTILPPSQAALLACLARGFAALRRRINPAGWLGPSFESDPSSFPGHRGAPLIVVTLEGPGRPGFKALSTDHVAMPAHRHAL